jgi:hypothetical protein
MQQWGLQAAGAALMLGSADYRGHSPDAPSDTIASIPILLLQSNPNSSTALAFPGHALDSIAGGVAMCGYMYVRVLICGSVEPECVCVYACVRWSPRELSVPRIGGQYAKLCPNTTYVSLLCY